jgi:acyl-CoA thioesterase
VQVVATRFETDTGVTEIAPGTYEGRIDGGWWIVVGPNGGYVAAMVLGALTHAVGDPKRSPRSFTVHYLAPPVEGPVQIEAKVERFGRRLTYLSARVRQGERLVALAMAAFAEPMQGPEFTDMVMPDAPPPGDVAPTVRRGAAPLLDRYEMRAVFGVPPFASNSPAMVGGWIRLREPQAIGHLVVAALTDAWIPPVFLRLERPIMVPTVDLTIHFRSELPRVSMPDDAFCLAVFRSKMSADGFVEEDGEVWSPDGVLLAHSRQLAIALNND